MRRCSPVAIRDSSARVLVLCAILPAVLACSDDIFAPTVDCDGAVGAIFIELQPAIDPALSYTVDVGDSIQVSASLRRVDASTEVFNPQQGWSCSTTASSPVSGSVTFTTTDTIIVRLGANGWIRGLQFGTALLTASSASPTASTQFGVLVYSP